MGKLTALVAEPGTALFDDALLESEIKKRSRVRNAFVIHDVELGLGEWRRDLVFHDFDLRAIAGNRAVAVLDRANTADVDTNAGVEFERLAAGRGLGVAKHDADLFANLVCEKTDGVRLRNE